MAEQGLDSQLEGSFSQPALDIYHVGGKLSESI